MKKIIMFICIVSILLTGCQKERPEAISASSLPSSFSDIALKKYKARKLNKEREMKVHHFLKDGKVYIECIVTPEFVFDEGTIKKEGHGYIDVYNNGKKIDQFTSGAFILTKLPKGTNNIDIVLKYNDDTDYGLKENFIIEIN